MGPEMQYVDEQPADPIELCGYRGANGSFSLYEDEGYNYDCEKKAFAETPMTWNEKSQTLTIGDRKGSFPGMFDCRTFQIVWVSQGHGGGEGPVPVRCCWPIIPTVHFTPQSPWIMLLLSNGIHQLTLRRVRYRHQVLSITIHGEGSRIKSFAINGKSRAEPLSFRQVLWLSVLV